MRMALSNTELREGFLEGMLSELKLQGRNFI